MMATRCCHVWNRILTFSWKENTQLAREVLLSNVDTKRNTQWALHYFHHHHIRSGISSHMTCNYHATWVTYYLGGRFKYLLCLPLTPILREMIQFDAHIFQMLCNHQLAIDNKRAIQDVCECSSCSACRCRLRMKWMWVQEIKVSCFLAFAKSTGVGQGGFEFAVQLAGFSMNLSFGWVLNFYILNLWHWWSHRQKHQSEKQTHIRQGVQDPWRTL